MLICKEYRRPQANNALKKSALSNEYIFDKTV